MIFRFVSFFLFFLFLIFWFYRSRLLATSVIPIVASVRFFFINLFTDFHWVFQRAPIEKRGDRLHSLTPPDYAHVKCYSYLSFLRSPTILSLLKLSLKIYFLSSDIFYLKTNEKLESTSSLLLDVFHCLKKI